MDQAEDSSLKETADGYKRVGFRFLKHAKAQKELKLKGNSCQSDESYMEGELESPPHYPDWVWRTVGCQDPYSLYGSAQQQGFYVDPSRMGRRCRLLSV